MSPLMVTDHSSDILFEAMDIFAFPRKLLLEARQFAIRRLVEKEVVLSLIGDIGGFSPLGARDLRFQGYEFCKACVEIGTQARAAVIITIGRKYRITGIAALQAGLPPPYDPPSTLIKGTGQIIAAEALGRTVFEAAFDRDAHPVFDMQFPLGAGQVAGFLEPVRRHSPAYAWAWLWKVCWPMEPMRSGGNRISSRN